jgi:hypothetical protein
MPLVDVPEADEPIEVPADAIEVQEDEDLVIKSQDELDDTIQSRLSRQERKLKDDLKADDEFWREMAQERGVELRDDGRPKGSIQDEELQELRSKANRAESLEQELSEQKERIQSAREERLEGKLLEKAPGFANETARDTYLREAKSRMTYDEEFGWVEADEEGGVRYDAGDPRGPDAVIAELEDSHEFLFESTQVSGGSDVTPSGDVGPMTEAEFEKKKEKAIQTGDDETLAELEQMAANDEIR